MDAVVDLRCSVRYCIPCMVSAREPTCFVCGAEMTFDVEAWNRLSASYAPATPASPEHIPGGIDPR